MAKKPENKAPEPINSVEALQQRIASMKEAQKKFSAFTQEQVDRIFFEAAMAANKQRIPLATGCCRDRNGHCGGQSHQKPLRSGVYLQHL